jgi:hypothetical protein
VNKQRKVSGAAMRPVKREAGENPARSRHRNSRAEAHIHWETGKGAEAFDRSAGRPAFRGMGTRVPGHEELAIRNFFPAYAVFSLHPVVKAFFASPGLPRNTPAYEDLRRFVEKTAEMSEKEEQK